MHTHDLQDLQRLEGPAHYGNYKPGSRFIQSWTRPSSFTLDDVFEMTLRKYVLKVEYHRPMINFEMIQIYGKIPKFDESNFTNTVCNIKDIMKLSGKNIRNTVKHIRRYLGYPTYFHRIEKSKLIPVELERIKKAYELIKENKSFIEVENTLFL